MTQIYVQITKDYLLLNKALVAFDFIVHFNHYCAVNIQTYLFGTFNHMYIYSTMQCVDRIYEFTVMLFGHPGN